MLYEEAIEYATRNVGNMIIREVGQVVDKNMPFFLKFMMFVASASFLKFVICCNLFSHSN